MVELPELVFRDLKIRAAQQGVKLKELVERYIVDGLERSVGGEVPTPARSSLPVFRSPDSLKHPAFSNIEIEEILTGEEWKLPSFDGGGIKIPLENLKQIAYGEETMRGFNRDFD